MQGTTDADARRPVIIYIIIAVVLFAALLLGIRWAKNRSAYYSQQQTGQSQPVADKGSQQVATTPSTQEPEQSSPAPTNETTSQPATSGTTSNPTPVVPSRVPATGPEQFILPFISLLLFTFAVTSYVRAKRRLLALASMSKS